MLFEFEGFHGFKSKCDIEVNDNVVVATQILDGTAGTSITNFAEGLAKLVCDRFGILYERLFWIEHYPNRLLETSPKVDESFDIVTFNVSPEGFSNPRWNRVPTKAIKLMFEVMRKDKESIY